jgi:hypothetical protein
MKYYEQEEHSKYTLQKLRQYESSNLGYYNPFHINQKMLSLVGLSKMFGETNKRVMILKSKKGQSVSPLFREISQVHEDMTKIFMKLNCKIMDSWNIPFEMTIDEYYKDD